MHVADLQGKVSLDIFTRSFQIKNKLPTIRIPGLNS